MPNRAGDLDVNERRAAERRAMGMREARPLTAEQLACPTWLHVRAGDHIPVAWYLQNRNRLAGLIGDTLVDEFENIVREQTNLGDGDVMEVVGLMVCAYRIGKDESLRVTVVREADGKVLGRFPDAPDAAAFIMTLPGYEDGLYGMDVTERRQ